MKKLLFLLVMGFVLFLSPENLRAQNKIKKGYVVEEIEQLKKVLKQVEKSLPSNNIFLKVFGYAYGSLKFCVNIGLFMVTIFSTILFYRWSNANNVSLWRVLFLGKNMKDSKLIISHDNETLRELLGMPVHEKRKVDQDIQDVDEENENFLEENI